MDSAFVEHIPCESCGSSDANSLYEDGHQYCFACETYVRGNGKKSGPSEGKSKKPKGLIDVDEIIALTTRNLTRETCEKFGYGIGENKEGKRCQIAPYRDAKGRVVAQKIRFAGKDFTATGDMKSAVLFGQHLWSNRGGKRLVITEGEIDALSAYQMLGSWPVVSVQNGASGAAKSIKRQLEFVESFEQVVLCFDQDDPGREAVEEIANLLSPGKALIMEMPRKDANEMLQENLISEFTKAFWNARVYQPDGIINGADAWELVNTDVEMGDPFPWEGLTEMTYGMRDAELFVWTSGSGMGKSEFVAEVAYHELMAGRTVGYVALEENCGKTGQRMMAKHLSVPIHLPGHEVTQEEKRKAFEATTGNGRFFMYDHWGSQDGDKLLSKIRFMIKAYDVDCIVLDHLSIIVSGLDDGDERKTIDVLMTNLRSLVEETGVRMHLVSHLRRPKGDKGHEQGEQVSLAHLRGSHSIVQLADFVFGLERNQQAKENSNVTKIRVLKNRYSGTTGLACAVRYEDTGRLNECDLEDEDDKPQRSVGEDFDEHGDF